MRLAALTVALAVAANVLVSQAERRLLDVPSAFTPLQPGPVVSVTAGATIVAALAYAALRRRRPFLVLCAAAALLSLAAPLLLLADGGRVPAVTYRGVAALVPLHLIPAAVAAFLLPRRA